MFLIQSAALPRVGEGEPAFAVVALLYFAAVAAIGIWAARRTKGASEFFLAGRSLGVVTMTIAAMAASLSGFAFIGGPGLIYTLGVGALFINLPLAITNTMGAWVLAKRLRLFAEIRDVLTIPDVIGIRYRSPAAQGLAAVAMIIATIGYMATNILAMGFVLDAILGIGLRNGIWIGSLVTLAYSATGGILAGVYTDVLQGVLMAVASVVVFGYVLNVTGGLSGITASIVSVDPDFIAPFGKITPLAALSFYFVFGIGTLGQPHVIHKFLMLKDPRKLRWYPLAMTVAMSLTLLLFVSVGLAVRALVSNGSMAPLARADDATPLFLLRYVPAGVAALVFAGVVAAIMSTLNSFLNIGAAALVHDIPKALGRVPSPALGGARIATVGLTALATLVAAASSTLVAFLAIFGWGMFAATLVPALAVGLNWRGATRVGAIASIGTGMGVSILLESLSYFKIAAFPSGVTPAAIALVSSLAVFLLISMATRSSVNEPLDADVAAVLDA